MNQQALAKAFKVVMAKKKKIQELGITPDMSDDLKDEIIKNLAGAKALENGEGTWKDYASGQQWYVDDLVKFSALTDEEMLDHEELEAFPKVADRAEMLAVIGNV